MLAKFVSTVVPVYLADAISATDAFREMWVDSLEEFDEGALCEDNVDIVPVKHSCCEKY